MAPDIVAALAPQGMLLQGERAETCLCGGAAHISLGMAIASVGLQAVRVA